MQLCILQTQVDFIVIFSKKKIINKENREAEGGGEIESEKCPKIALNYLNLLSSILSPSKITLVVKLLREYSFVAYF